MTIWPVLSRMAMAMPQLFFTDSASAAAITFLAASSPMGGPYGVVGGGDGACCPLAAAVAKTIARMEASPVLVCVFICFLPCLLVGLREGFQDRILGTTDQLSGSRRSRDNIVRLQPLGAAASRGDGSVRQELAAGFVLRSEGRSAFGGKAENWAFPLSTPKPDDSNQHPALLEREDCTLVAWYPSLYAPRTGGAYDSHHRTSGIAGRTRRCDCGVADPGARAAVGDAGGRISQ